MLTLLVAGLIGAAIGGGAIYLSGYNVSSGRKGEEGE